MSRVRGRSFKITKNQARGYGYAKPGMRRNPGVTSIAAINGRGAYGGSRSARSVMSKLSRNARPTAARRALSSAQKRAFQAKLHQGGNWSQQKRRVRRHIAKMSPASRKAHKQMFPAYHENRATSRAQRASSRQNIKKAQKARRLWGQKLPRGQRVRVGTAAYGRKPKARRLKAGVYIANKRKKAGKSMARRRRKSATGATKKRRRTSKRRRKTTTASPKRRRTRRKKATSRRKTTRKATSRRRRKTTRKATRKATSRRRRKTTRKATSRRRRKTTRKATSRRRRKTTRKATSRRRKSSGRRRLRPNRRRRHRRNVSAKAKLKANRRRKRSSGRRRHRRNGSRALFRKNSAGGLIKMSGVILLGFGVHRLLTNLVDRQILARFMPAPVAAEPAATSGFNLSAHSGLLASVGVGVSGAYLVNKLVKNQETKRLVIGGIVASTLQGIIMSVLRAAAPSAADMLSGPEDATAARLSAMYGLGAGTSIQPRYAPIGEYFREPMRGMGEYFREPVAGLGEYLTATNGLGTYEGNSDIYQAAAGFGSHDYEGNHIDPSGDLDRQLTIAEAAAGVGAIPSFEAAAGMGSPMGPMQAAAGFGAVSTVPSADTWIPGSADPQLWAGVRSVSEPQSATEMVPAGILQTDGGQGIFG